MLKLDATQLALLGAPAKSGAAAIEEWLRALLRRGALRLDTGQVELRGPEPVITTLGDLKRACGVAIETVKQGLRPLEMEHWVLLVDGAHTRLLGPPRFRLSVTKENLWGSLSQAIQVSVADELIPLESIDYDRLRQKGSVAGCKQLMAVAPITLTWSTRVRLADGDETELKPGETFVLAAGSFVRHAGVPGTLEQDRSVVLEAARALRLQEPAELILENGAATSVPSGTLIHLERSCLVRLSRNRTGLFEIASHCAMESEGAMEWGSDSVWLTRFRAEQPLVLVRRAIYAELHDVVSDPPDGAAHERGTRWRVALGYHDCVLDATLPFQAGQGSEDEAPGALSAFLGQLGKDDSLRQRIGSQYGFNVESAEVRISPATFCSAYDRGILRRISTDPALNSELLSQTNRIPCWTQMGAYHRKGDPWPWEVTREVYFTFVNVDYRQRLKTDRG